MKYLPNAIRVGMTAAILIAMSDTRSLEVVEGLVTAVCMSPEHRFPTVPQQSVYIGE